MGHGRGSWNISVVNSGTGAGAAGLARKVLVHSSDPPGFLYDNMSAGKGITKSLVGLSSVRWVEIATAAVPCAVGGYASLGRHPWQQRDSPGRPAGDFTMSAKLVDGRSRSPLRRRSASTPNLLTGARSMDRKPHSVQLPDDVLGLHPLGFSVGTLFFDCSLDGFAWVNAVSRTSVSQPERIGLAICANSGNARRAPHVLRLVPCHRAVSASRRPSRHIARSTTQPRNGTG